ncbi:formyl-CoA transferase [Olsenella sp. YH-ols2217]|uniref:Formyl-CoA:oxalate CoA-transferase n=1 Tax=Kribbibacterium absianum TaxID=3044210 RepID=A0ABT6ZMQ4_9ACTN|nr:MULTISPECIES: formyl-CoA transferase [unclassified Olsenella]MDJ1122252.1 formyl-CoA transferase [Olsenella sp. YH-ols2216]MDJ1130334.1 formyl-CoA transferase [Olsenella sp. YH-ols2217]
MAEQTNTAPLAGIKVIDWTQVQSGPSCTQLLAWLGAEVIKIEKIDYGDPTRNELLDIADSWSLYFLQLNANKKSLTLNMKTEQGKQILTDLLKDADVFVENIGPGDVEKLGFGWDVVHKINPRCIMASLKGFNQGSRFAHVKAFEPVAQSAGGAASTTGWNEGEFNVPTQSAAALGDSNTGMHLAIGILAALVQREHTGEGCYVYQSMQSAVLNLCRIKLRDQIMLDNLGALPHYEVYPDFNWGKAIPRAENTEGGQVIGWCYKAKGWETDPNAYVYIVAQNPQKDFVKLCEAIGNPDLANDPRFDCWQHRQLHKKELYPYIEAYTKQYDKYTLTEELGKAGVPVGPVLDWYELEHDEQLEQEGTMPVIDQGGARGDFKTIGLPFSLSNFTPTYKRAPDLGENNKEILTGLGYSEEQIEQLLADNVISPVKTPSNPRTQVLLPSDLKKSDATK